MFGVALWAIVIVALRVPVAVGLKVTSTEHDAFGASEAAGAQVPVRVNSVGLVPPSVIVDRTRLAVPLLVRVADIVPELGVDQLGLLVAEIETVAQAEAGDALLAVEGGQGDVLAEGELGEHDRHVDVVRPVEDAGAVRERQGVGGELGAGADERQLRRAGRSRRRGRGRGPVPCGWILSKMTKRPLVRGGSALACPGICTVLARRDHWQR